MRPPELSESRRLPSVAVIRSTGRPQASALTCPPPGGEVLRLAGGRAVHGDADHLVASRLRAFRGPVECNEQVSAVLLGELHPGVEREAERRRVGLHSDFRCAHAHARIRTPELGIRQVAGMAPGPAEVVALTYEVDRFGREVVAEPVAPIVGRPQLIAPWSDRKAHGITQAAREDAATGAVRRKAKNGRTPFVVLRAHVATRSDRDIERRPVGAEPQRAGVVPTVSG